MTSTQTAATIESGDVTLFARKFGAPGKAPIVILHGGNYYDSADWVDVGEQLAVDREVAAFDARGFGNSSWSASRDYGFASALGDIRAVLGHFGWQRAIIVGHSRGGAHALLAASRAPEIAAGLVLVDYSPALGFGPPGGAPPAADAAPPVFPTVEAAFGGMSRYQPVPLTSEARARALQFLEPVEGGFRLAKRDPSFMSHEGATGVPLVPRDGLDELADVRCPILVIRAKRSPIFKPEDLAHLGSIDRLELREIDSGHDVVGEAPDAFVAAMSDWLRRA
ncbi:MAG TPA: alpha/beta hydrolase [Allosphingosinicella sp.]|nr:alpha/beta hydrolase [Allosphingosinicella sp.]